MLVVFEQADTGVIVGDCMVLPLADPNTVDLSYGIASSEEGKGYAAEAIPALVDWLLERSEVRCVRATVVAGNAASIKVLRRAGLEEHRAGHWQRRVELCRRPR